MDPDYQQLFGELHAATVSSRVNWQKTSRDNLFLVYFKSFAVSLKYVSPEADSDYIETALHDEGGNRIDQFWIHSGDAEWTRAAQMYHAARRRALRIDVALDTILGELRSGKEVGSDAPAKPKGGDDNE